MTLDYAEGVSAIDVVNRIVPHDAWFVPGTLGQPGTGHDAHDPDGRSPMQSQRR